MTDRTKEILDRLVEKYPALAVCREEILESYKELCSCFSQGGKLLLCGNGGSEADCDHIVGELMKGFLKKRPLNKQECRAIDGDEDAFAHRLQSGLPAINLCAHSALLSAVSNDLGEDLIYAQQVIGYGESKDILMGLSTSGNAENVCRAVRVARARGMKTIAMTGRSGGKLYELCDITIRVPTDRTPDIQELHLPVYHALCAMVEATFFEK